MMLRIAQPRHIPSADDLGRLPDHTNPADLAMMADAIRALKGDDRLFFACEMVTQGLMEQTVEKGDEVAMMLMEQAKAMNALPKIAAMMFGSDENCLDDMIEVTAKHCTEGVDLTDEASVGGWNKTELASAYACLYVARNGLTIPFGANVQ